MMSFRHATDATYIAQLLGRMIRTPMQMHIQVDETLNDVHLYLPYFNSDTVKKVVEELQNTEGGDIPADIYGESLDNRVMDTLSVRPRSTSGRGTKHTPAYPGQMSLFEQLDNVQPMKLHDGGAVQYGNIQIGSASSIHDLSSQNAGSESIFGENNQTIPTAMVAENHGQTDDGDSKAGTLQTIHTGTESQSEPEYAQETFIDTLDREGIVKAINDSGLLSYDVRNVRINNYLNSLYSLARLLRQSGKYLDATDDVLEEIVTMIRKYIGGLKSEGKYDEVAHKVVEFQMKSQVFDVFGETVNDNIIPTLMSTTDSDIDRQFRRAETKLGNEGVGNKYGQYYYDEDNPNAYKIDVILYASNDDCYARLLAYAEKVFHKMNDNYRRKIVGLGDRFIKQYDAIVSNGDAVSKHNFRLPETISLLHEVNGKDYEDHLFVDDNGKARINLNNWEEGVLAEEQRQADFVCWLRNPPRKPWSLCIPYETGGEQKRAYPDFIIIRKGSDDEYVVDILEPHDPTRIDNLGKARGFAEYARQNPGVGRIQLIRMGKDAVGHNRFKRLDMAMSTVRDKVSRAMTNDELDHIFDIDGFFVE